MIAITVTARQYSIGIEPIRWALFDGEVSAVWPRHEPSRLMTSR